jgi:hypothetical protein
MLVVQRWPSTLQRLLQKCALQKSALLALTNYLPQTYLPVTPVTPAPGGVDEVPWLSAKMVPKAAPAAATAPILNSSERVWCCLAGAIATPAGLAAAPPAVGTLSAVAAPTGSVCVLGCGASGIVVVCAGAALCDGCCCGWSEASGYVVTGFSGACDGFTVVPDGAGCCG